MDPMTNLKEFFYKAFLNNEVRNLKNQITNPPSQIQTWSEWLLPSDDILFEKRKSNFKKEAENNLLKYQSGKKLRIAGVGIIGLVPVLATIVSRLLTR